MSTAVVLAFAGVLPAVVGTGTVAGKCIRAPRGDLVAWSLVLFLLTVTLGAQTVGFAVGFGELSFRVAAVSGLLLAPLWTAWGLVELVARTVPARFATRLATGALTVVAGVILSLDPLNTSPPFGKGWPGEARYMALPNTALTVVHLFTVVIALSMMTLAAVRTRRDPAWWDAFVPAAAAGAAVLLMVSLGLSLPSLGYPLLAAIAAAIVWFAASRSERVRLDQLRDEQVPGGRASEPRPGHRRRQGPAEPGETTPARDGPPRQPGGDGRVSRERAGAIGDGRPGGAEVGSDLPGDSLAALAAGALPAGRDAGGPAAALAAAGRRAAPKLFGLIAIYTLADGCGDDFDRLAERTVESVRRNEPDTLMFVVHTVANAPMQRIFYEVYRDRMAYSEHRRQPGVERFFAKHRPYVLATNVIELDLKYAKVAALPSLAATPGHDNGG